MLSDNIIEFIQNEAKEVLKNKDEYLLDMIWDAIQEGFQKWKGVSGDRNPKVSGGLLSEASPLKFEDAKPWECANLIFPSPIGLGLMLIQRDDQIFRKLVALAKNEVILALLIAREGAKYHDDALFFAYQYMIKKRAIKQGQLATYLEHYNEIEAGQKLRTNLAKGNPAASKKKSEVAENHQRLWKQWAHDILKVSPYMEMRILANKVLELANRERHKMANGKPYQASTIERVISGIKKSIKNSM